jgi:O-antigen ligase
VQLIRLGGSERYLPGSLVGRIRRTEKVMVSRSSHAKLAVALLVPVLWATGSAVQALWMTPVIIFVLWIALQFRLGYRRRHRGA